MSMVVHKFKERIPRFLCKLFLCVSLFSQGGYLLVKQVFKDIIQLVRVQNFPKKLTFFSNILKLLHKNKLI